jgi:hypothetical protein
MMQAGFGGPRLQRAQQGGGWQWVQTVW